MNTEELRDLIPAYSVGALDPDERAEMETALSQNPELAEELAAYQVISERLLYSVPQVAPPRGLVGDVLAKSSRKPDNLGNRRMVDMPRRRIDWRWLMAAVLVLVLLAGSNLYWLTRINDLEDENKTLTAQLNTPKQPLNQLGSGPASQVQLTRDEDETNASLAWVSTNDDQDWVAWVVARALPVATYQVWIERDGEAPLLIGELDITELDENGSLVFEIDEPIQSYDRFYITLKDDGPSPENAILSTDL
jgi:anti-sigma-K factor RskA